MIDYNSRVPPISLSQFLSRSTTYENLPAPISPVLRRATWWGLALCAVSLLIYPVLSVEAISWYDSSFFLLLGEQFGAIVYWINNHIAPFVLLSLLGIVFSISLIAASGGLKQAKKAGHVLAFIIVIVGVICSLPLVAALTIVAINVIAYVVIAVVQLVIAVVVIGVLFGMLFGAFTH